MATSRVWSLGPMVLGVLLCALGLSGAQSNSGTAREDAPAVAAEPFEELPGTAGSIGATVIHPFQSANLGTELGGVIEAFHFDEGDKVEKDQVVVEISKKRYRLAMEQAEVHLKSLELARARAEEDLKLKRGVFSQEATTRQEVLRAEAEVEIARSRVDEAVKQLAIARLNLEQCEVKAPFTGFLAVRYQQPFETVDRFTKLFLLVDTATVYAVANVPESVLSRLKKGDSAVFVHGSGKRSTCEVKKIGTLVDPKSGTAKVHALIDNRDGALRVGTAGRLEVGR
ncbi:MAG: efflux RND transporter periplasmic adaptor subunit [Thermodesulfobacteriota bacterium]